MKAINYIIITVLFLFSSCYIYRPFSESDINVATTKTGSNSVLRGNDRVPSVRASQANSSVSMNASSGLKMSEEEEKNQKLNESKQAELDKEKEKAESEAGGKTEERSKMGNLGLVRNELSASKSSNAAQKNVTLIEGELTLKEKLQPTKYYKIHADGKQYKIQVDGWEGDTLKAHILRKPHKELRFHENQIDEETVLSRRFSKPFSDLFTVGSYAVGGAVILFLVL